MSFLWLISSLTISWRFGSFLTYVHKHIFYSYNFRFIEQSERNKKFNRWSNEQNTKMKRQIQDYHRESVLSSLSIPSNESMMKNFQTKKSRLFQNKKKNLVWCFLAIQKINMPLLFPEIWKLMKITRKPRLHGEEEFQINKQKEKGS